MAQDDEDHVTGSVGKAKRADVSGVSGRRFVPSIAAAKGSTRARAAWHNRAKGAPRVKLASARPAGQQRVIVKINPVVHARVKGGAGGLMRHALYVQRDGADRIGEPALVFDRDHDEADGRAFVDRCAEDRHHFRVIIAPEFGEDFADLKSYTRELVQNVEADLGTEIDWVAAEHHDTGRPHIHLLMRGVREDGRDLVIPRPYVSHGFRERAEALATRELGPRPEHSHERAVALERFTHLDRDLNALARDGLLSLSDLPDEARHRAALAQRLTRLEDWKLAERTGPGQWRLDAELELQLTRRADRAERERATTRLLAAERLQVESGRLRQLELGQDDQRMTGRLLGWTPLGTDPDGPQLIAIEGLDGKLWTARVARLEALRELNGIRRGAVIELGRSPAEVRASDRTIFAIAQENALAYSPEIHRQSRPKDRDVYIEMHKRRLEALRREGLVERERDGTFRIPPDYLERVVEREGGKGRESAEVRLLDPHGLEIQARYGGPTWLDRVSAGEERLSHWRNEGFGAEFAEAWKQRETTLAQEGLGEKRHDGFYRAADAHERLVAMEQEMLISRIERERGLEARVARDGERVEGLYSARFRLAEQDFALIEHGHSAVLAPWRPEMDVALNHFVSGRVRGQDFDFKYGQEVEKNLGLDLGR